MIRQSGNWSNFVRANDWHWIPICHEASQSRGHRSRHRRLPPLNGHVDPLLRADARVPQHEAIHSRFKPTWLMRISTGTQDAMPVTELSKDWAPPEFAAFVSSIIESALRLAASSPI